MKKIGRERRYNWHRAARRIGQKALAFFAGLMAALLMIELALAGLGRIVTADKDNEIRKSFENLEEWTDANFVIACFGDSFTYGIGASSKNDAYPSQLEKILSERYPDMTVRVLNHGVPGTNSSQHIKYMKKSLPAYPRALDVVYILSFGANQWNLNEYSAIVEGHAKLPMSKHLYEKIEKTRIGKLAVLLRLYGLQGAFASRLARDDFREQGEKNQTLLNIHNIFDREFIKAWIEHDMLEMRKTVESAGSRALFGLYHKSPVNDLIRESAMKQSIPFCEAPPDGARWRVIGAWDNETDHPNDLGYAKMAENIADCLRLNHLIPETALPR